jgi:hypothetical protein
MFSADAGPSLEIGFMRKDQVLEEIFVGEEWFGGEEENATFFSIISRKWWWWRWYVVEVKEEK